jgi:uncharacterized protein
MPQPVVHFEIGCRDVAKTTAFFSKLFDWEITPGPVGHVAPGQGGIGGHIHSLGHEPEHYVTVYVEVDDLPSYLKKIEELGGKIIVPPVSLPNGTFAWFTDPDGTTLGLWQPKPGV